ncbi:NAD(P)H-hydrate dehydratase [Gymnodinialimonas sp. 57CJ19]|uniref:NAD(P)H-hydrate dehydratase n=1 Tax=Gymnodinialimonas sp. 57CJ19 TaxID=3138498 RepID=UPI0031344258
MTQLLTSTQMRRLEKEAMDSGRATGLDLMERAGQAVIDAVFSRWPALAATPQKAVVLCGPGNNGGDGYVIARLLQGWGWHVSVFALGTPDKATPDAQSNHARWLEIGSVADLAEAHFDGAALIVDAIFGIGLSRGFAPPPSVGAAFHSMFADGVWGHGQPQSPFVVAVDVPSGLDADSGVVLGAEGDWVGDIGAHLTVTFHAPKHGHVLADGPQLCGELVVADIGLRGAEAEEHDDFRFARLPDPLLAEPSLAKGLGHKYNHGHALLVSGPMGRSGAARMAARAALRIGAGLVTLAVPGSAMMECAAHLTAIMTRKCDGADAFDALLGDARFNALCLGPAMGIGPNSRAMVASALAAERPVVLDADALTAFADDPAALFDMLHPQAILTPHGGEFARLFPQIAARMNAPATQGPAYSKVDATREAAAVAGCIVLFKGADTVIAAPGGRVRVHSAAYHRAAPWLATAGAGDVLAGIITGLLARGFDPLWAAEAGAYLHVEAARAGGPGLIAEDLPELLPKVLRAHGL